MEVTLQVDVPWGEVALVPKDGGLAGLLEIRVAARDHDGTVSEMARIPLPLERKEPPNPRTILRWEAELTLRREHHDLIVTLYDAVSREVMTRRVAVEP